MNLRSVAICVLVLGASACAVGVNHVLDRDFGSPRPLEVAAVATTASIEYERDIRPIMDNRCLVCHGCYDAPCQLKLDSYEGILRGASPEQVYSTARLKPAPLTRLFEDHSSTAEWRTAGFHPVLNERRNSPDANLQAGVMARMLQLKQDHPLPDGKVLPDTFDFSLSRSQECPTIEEFDSFASKYPLWGMPFGFPSLSASEHDKLKTWLAAGAPAAAPASLPDSLAKEVLLWESFFNGDSHKERLAARYLYEHLFLAHLYLQDSGRDTRFFKLVRSRTPPGQPISTIATRRPYDDPGVERVYYRLWRDPATVIAKTHMPYRLSAERLDRWKKWFIDATYTVDAPPGYDPRTASNPFVTFQSIPYQSRYKFLLDEAQFTIMNFIKGPVCRGNVALDVIQDRFWVFFATPDTAMANEISDFLASQDAHLRLPAQSQSGLTSIVHWRQYAKAQNQYLTAKGDFIRRHAAAFVTDGLNNFWNGDGSNANAALTVFRHSDSASVVQGLVGEPPQTAWLIDYPILERIHYLLVAGFDVYGTAGHQLMTRIYMDFLRMESEMNFVAYLPQQQRLAEVDQWYQGAQKDVQAYLDAYFEHEVLPSPVAYRTATPKLELYALLQQRLAPITNRSYSLDQSGLSNATIVELRKLEQVRGTAVSVMPQVITIKVKGHGVVSVLNNSDYTNISSMFGEASRRLVAGDSLTVANGVVGAYPNMFLEIEERETADLVAQITRMKSDGDYRQLLDRFAVRRTNDNFWRLSDEILSDYQHAEPLTSGVLDLNRYENR